MFLSNSNIFLDPGREELNAKSNYTLGLKLPMKAGEASLTRDLTRPNTELERVFHGVRREINIIVLK